MNLELIDPFTKTVPDRLDCRLERIECEDDAVVCSFNRRGNYLAVGYDTGSVVIWDFLARGVSRIIPAHSDCVTYVGWSRRSRALLTSSFDGHLTMWDLTQEVPEISINVCIQESIIQAQLHPFKNIAVVVLESGISWLVDTISGSKRLTLSAEQMKIHATGSTKKDYGSRGARITSASFDPSGNYLFLGTGGGRIIVFDGTGCNLLQSYAVEGCPMVHQIAFSRGRTNPCMLIGSKDRCVRILPKSGEKGNALREIRDTVNNARWDVVGFSADAEYVVGGSNPTHGQYHLYIWNTANGLLQEQIGGTTPLASAMCIAWHPTQPFIAVAAEHSGVDIWGCHQGANWTAFAADFVELEANIMYEEKEDEFDTVVMSDASVIDDSSLETHAAQNEEIIDIVNIHKVPAFASDSEDERDIFTLRARPGKLMYPLVHRAPERSCCTNIDKNL